ncbi:MAG TPA: DUF4389 domain-containing protein [Gaiellaceae bacterium]|nr:DUF4389 domain-containing protein [Gaiellaceae bacterium]
MDLEHPVRLLVEDDLERSRLTVFFRWLLAIPHILWAIIWSVGVFFAAIANWAVTLVRGRPPDGLHAFMSSYVRYLSHLYAYLWLAASPYPGFVGEEGTYPVDVTLPPPDSQPRWQTFFRIFLAVPVLLLAAAIGGAGAWFQAGGRRGGGTYSWGSSVSGLASTTAVLAWFATLARGRTPKGFRDVAAYAVGYQAQVLAYLLLVTARYPSADPTALLETVERPPLHPVHLVGDAHDLRRSRVLVFFRLPLAIPHIVWLLLWTIAALVAVVVNWFVLLVRARPADPLHRFVSRYVRYGLHVYAFLFLAANPFPGFTGEAGSYPLDLVLPAAQRQHRGKTLGRAILAIPAIIVSGALGGVLYLAAFLTWFVALARGSAPWGLRNVSAYALRYQAQVNAYLLLLTDTYPHSSPLEGAADAQQALELDVG